MGGPSEHDALTVMAPFCSPGIFGRLASGRRIRRKIEQRFDAVLHEIARSDPARVRRVPHARWLLDNSHLVRQALQQVQTDLPRGFLRQLPRVQVGTESPMPRIFALVWKFLRQSELPVDIQALHSLCRDYRDPGRVPHQLSLGELWAVPIALRIGLLCQLCEEAESKRPLVRGDAPQATEAGNPKVVAGCIVSLRAVETRDWTKFVEYCSAVARYLALDPAGRYQDMDFDSRDRYLGVVERLARRAGREEPEVAQAALQLARQAADGDQAEHLRHVGYYLVDQGRLTLQREVAYRATLRERLAGLLRAHRMGLYLGAITGLSALGSGLLLLWLLWDGLGMWASVSAALLALVPLMSVASGAVNFLLSHLVAPARLAKLDFSDGIPAGHRSIVVVPMMLSCKEEIRENLFTLEKNYLGNADRRLHFALLSDFLDASEAQTPADLALLRQAQDGINALNSRYRAEAGGAGPFLLFHRRRTWNGQQKVWMGSERKRGKLEEFNDLLRGDGNTGFVLQHGDRVPDFRRIRYVITLDADSYLPTGAAARLVGAMAHPLNRPRPGAGPGRLDGGFSVIQPRLETNPVTGADNLFERIFAGDVLLDLYTHAVSNVYQDVFGVGIFVGKGIYDLDAFRSSVAGKLPANAILSHDLLEGLLGRVGLASDIMILENYPSSYVAYLKRLHRWIRGDWQLLPWLFRRRTVDGERFSPGAIGRWMLFDNLRRSLLTPTMLALLLLGWLLLPANIGTWTLVFAVLPGLPILLPVTLALRTSAWRWGTIEASLRNLLRHAGADAARWIAVLVFLPTEARVVVDAVLRSLYRIGVSHKNMLEWTTAAQDVRSMAGMNGVRVLWRRLWFGPVMSGAGALAIAVMNPAALPAAAPLLLCWLFSPLAAWVLGRTPGAGRRSVLSDAEQRLLRSLARQTWRFFERFVGPASSWLPPDNVQEYPRRVIAERTSPTNIGMMLLSTLTAFDMGYLGSRQLVARLQNHLDTLLRLPKHRGHLFNWYATRDLHPLNPRYVSTVDSGNFLAALIVMCQYLEHLPVGGLRPPRALAGLMDELEAKERELFGDTVPGTDAATRELAQALAAARGLLVRAADPVAAVHELEQQHCTRIEQGFLHAIEQNPVRWSAEQIANFRENSKVLHERIRHFFEDVALFAPWLQRPWAPPGALAGSGQARQVRELKRLLDSLQGPGDAARTLEQIEARLVDIQAGADGQVEAQWLETLRVEVSGARAAVEELVASGKKLTGQARALVEATDFRFLYDNSRHLFRVGYNATTGEDDPGYYDLLASEARIASLVAIAKGDVPSRHWVHLGRPLTRIRGLRILLSWSATAFEYLMPRLLMHSPPGSLLNQSCEGAVRQQMRFGRRHGIPWGISESGYARFDAHDHYQYYAFGIPGLGLKWDQGERLVVSGYSSALALPYAPAEAVENLERLVRLGGLGHYGLFEAMDFGHAQKHSGALPQVVQSYMTHHQGMIMVAIGNALYRDRVLRHFHSDPRIASVEHLLYERLPQRIKTRHLERLPSPLKELPGEQAVITQWELSPEQLELAVLSNGHLSTRVSGQGGGAMFWRGAAVTRWNPLEQGATGGLCLYMKDLDTDRLLALGSGPLPEGVRATFAPHKAEFLTRDDSLLMRLTVCVAPSADVELRRIRISNDGSRPRRVMLCSYGEPVLGQEGADRRHPAFSKLFIESSLLGEEATLMFRRRPREPDEPPVYLAHKAIGGQSRLFQVDRGVFIGRGGSPAAPAALVGDGGGLENRARASLDPCMAIALTLEVPPGSTAECAYLSAVGGSRQAVTKALSRFESLDRVDWAVEEAGLQAERELTSRRLGSQQVRAAYHLFADLLWPRALPQIADDAFDEIRQVQDILWRHGISGDRPIVSFRLDGDEDLSAAEALLERVAYLNGKGVAIDVVFLDETKGGYTFPTNERLRKLVEAHVPPSRGRSESSAFIVPAGNLAPREKACLLAAARLHLEGERESTALSTGQYFVRMPEFVPQPSAPLSTDRIRPVSPPADLQLACGPGGLERGLDGYSLLISGDSRTPAPWCNVLANPGFGTLVSESGSMCTWWGNSSEYRLTPWSNDPVLDRGGEALYLRDEETAESWSLTPAPRPGSSAYRVTHRIGETRFEHNSHGLEQRLQVFVDPEHPVKFLRIRLANRWPRARRLTLTYAVEWLIGNAHGMDRHLRLPDRDPATGALLVRDAYARQGGEQVAFVASGLPAHGVTTDGTEFLGNRGSWAAPAGLAAIGLSKRISPCARPFAVYQVHLELAPGQVTQAHFVLGASRDMVRCRQLLSLVCNADWVRGRHRAMRQRWESLLGTWRVNTPDVAADAAINHWLLYQLISSRLWGRIGFYQASGGYGFRDQLQDVLALLDADPGATRAQIIQAASRQFPEGDVLHWWHEGPLRGVRTRCSDDLLWLAYAVSEYIEVTGDQGILRATAPFLRGEALSEHELERYAEFQETTFTASIYEHCCRAIDARLAVGAHGMPFIGTGDWNDGLNRVGEKGRGESVWMAWFLVVVCRRFVPLCQASADPERASRYEKLASDLLARTRDTAWAGEWYLRGYFDDGTPLGAPGDAECEIDLNAQTWAVMADPSHPDSRHAMDAAGEKLLDPEHRLIRLLTPPFERNRHDPGYIMSYPPGVRENGGQYTHAAVWAAWAAVELGDADAAMRYFQWLNPFNRCRDEDEMQRYRLEPYVTPGDIYSVGELSGRGGWSWYTGSAAWLYRLALRRLLGLQRQGDRLYVRPCLPASWPEFQASLRQDEAQLRIRVHQPSEIREDALYLLVDGSPVDARWIALDVSGEHELQVFGSDAARAAWRGQSAATTGS